LTETDALEKRWRGHMCRGLLSTQGPWFGAKLAAGPDQLELTGLLGHFVFTPQNVERVERAGFFPWFWMGIRIRHHISNYPDRIMFWPVFSFSQGILEHFKLLGYNVT